MSWRASYTVYPVPRTKKIGLLWSKYRPTPWVRADNLKVLTLWLEILYPPQTRAAVNVAHLAQQVTDEAAEAYEKARRGNFKITRPERWELVVRRISDILPPYHDERREPDTPPRDFAEYSQRFTSRLAQIVQTALELQNSTVARMHLTSFFSPKVCAEAAGAGFELGLPLGDAVSFLVLVEALSFERNQSRLALTFYPPVRRRHAEFRALADVVGAVAKQYEGSELPGQFLKRLTEGLRA